MLITHKGGIVKQEAAIHISNLNLKDPSTGVATRVGRRAGDDGKLVRFAKKSGGGDQVMSYTPSLKTMYKEQVVPTLIEGI